MKMNNHNSTNKTTQRALEPSSSNLENGKKQFELYFDGANLDPNTASNPTSNNLFDNKNSHLQKQIFDHQFDEAQLHNTIQT